MSDSRDSGSGSKPVWFALAAALAIIGLVVTVALPVSTPSSARSSRLSAASAEWNGFDPALQPLPAGLIESGMRSQPTEGDGAAPTATERHSTATDEAEATGSSVAPAAEAEANETSDSDSSRPKNAEELAALRAVLQSQFEELSRVDPRAAKRFLDQMAQGIAEDPEVMLMQSENAAISTLRNIASSQAQLQASGAIDVDLDGKGEYGTFAELSAGCTLRGTTNALNPPVLSAAFRRVQRGVVERNGYFFAIFLPDVSGQGLAENYEGGAHMALFQAQAADACERLWCAYAWPVSSQLPGRVFFINQEGDVLARENGLVGELTYAGADGPNADSAFDATTMPGTILGRTAHGVAARDGGRWIVVQ